jgi:hypothetical protein
MKKQQIVWCLFMAVFFLPNAIYFLVNLYWWLWDGNIPIADKMTASLLMSFVSGAVGSIWETEARLWRKH